ncbi:MAG: CHAD domain-containing protein [Vicinamibacterales bacterium]
MADFSVLLRERTRELIRHVAAAVKGEARGIHGGRVASRRLRESLPVAGATAARLTASRARKTFRQLTRALGPVRELDVALVHLEDGLDGIRIPRVTIERVRTHVLAERERRRQKMLTRLERIDLSTAAARVERVARAAPARMISYGAEALSRRVRVRARTLDQAIARAGTLYDPERLHAVRIAVKKLRYSLEVVAASELLVVTDELRLLKRAQRILGRMHDYQVLLEHVGAVADVTPPAAPGAQGLKLLASAYDRECRRLHAGYLKMAPALADVGRRLFNLRLAVPIRPGRARKHASERSGA